MCMNVETKPFSLVRHDFELDVAPDYLFMPNQTTKLFTKSITIYPHDVVFDIGSGVGPLTVWAAKEPSEHVYSVEIVRSQFDLLMKNLEKNNVEDKVSAYCGSFFGPFQPGLKADAIIADVSGIAEGPARALGWYPEEIPTGGYDGTEVIIPVLEQAGRYLHDGGRLYFPCALDLSDGNKIMKSAASNFRNLERKVNVQFPLTAKQHEDLVASVKEEQHYIKTDRMKGSRNVWIGQIYEATDPIL
jgi:methylase of polypeptide subunit release factors